MQSDDEVPPLSSRLSLSNCCYGSDDEGGLFTSHATLSHTFEGWSYYCLMILMFDSLFKTLRQGKAASSFCHYGCSVQHSGVDLFYSDTDTSHENFLVSGRGGVQRCAVSIFDHGIVYSAWDGRHNQERMKILVGNKCEQNNTFHVYLGVPKTILRWIPRTYDVYSSIP